MEGTVSSSLWRSAFWACMKLCLTVLYTARSITHRRHWVVDLTVAARGAEYSSANSPNELRHAMRIIYENMIVSCGEGKQQGLKIYATMYPMRNEQY